MSSIAVPNMDAEVLAELPADFTGNVGILRALKSSSVAYLKPVLGKILPKALCEICEKRPPDPIEELARWLYQWADCELYYYEKAIFAKELQLMALHVEKETSRRLARTQALKRETMTLKYLTSNQRALVSFLGKTEKVSRHTFASRDSAFEYDMQAWSREHAGGAADDMSARSASISSEGHITSLSGRRRTTMSDSEERRKRKKLSLTDDLERPSTRPSSRLRVRKTFGDQDSEPGRVSKYEPGRVSKFEPGRISRSGKGKKVRLPGESDEDDRYDTFADSYGADAKLRFGFEVTPVQCTWYLAEPNILVCVHPVLGEIRATIPTKTPLANTPEWWEQNQFQFAVMYDHEIYTHPSPHFDDDKYKDRMQVWVYDELQDKDYVKQQEDKSTKDA